MGKTRFVGFSSHQRPILPAGTVERNRERSDAVAAGSPLILSRTGHSRMFLIRRADTVSMSSCLTTGSAGVPARLETETNWWSRRIAWVVAARSHRVICLILGIWLINAFDLIFTILSHEQGVLVEQNPFARKMLELGVASLVLYKIGLVLIGSYPLIKFRAARITEWGTLVVFLSYATLAVRWSDCYEAYHVALSANPHLIELHSEAAFTTP